MFHGVEMMQKIEMKQVARKMLIYLGAIPLMSLENLLKVSLNMYLECARHSSPTQQNGRGNVRSVRDTPGATMGHLRIGSCGYLVADGC